MFLIKTEVSDTGPLGLFI